MSLYKAAIKLAKQGFHIFPLKENGKTPIVDNFTGAAVLDPKDLKKFWFDDILELEHQYNIGVATTKFKKAGALLVVDIDDKDGKKGSENLLKLELEGFEFPTTLTQTTPTKGRHLIYKCKEPVKQGSNVLAEGIDIRSRGGYIVGAGSLIENVAYKMDSAKIADAPEWLIEKCNDVKYTEERAAKVDGVKVDQKLALKRARDFLERGPVSIQGEGGDHTAFMVVNRIKDMGVIQESALPLLQETWNERCDPPWSYEELEQKVINAYVYGQNAVGVDAPESDFEKVAYDEDGRTPIQKLNEEFAFIVLGGKSTIVQKRADGEINYMSVQAFHDLLKAFTIQGGSGRKKQLSEVWFAHESRPTYHSAELHPGREAPEGVYNLWRGFKCEPLADDEEPTKQMLEGVRLFKEHALENICLGNEELFSWLMGYFAHLVQKPWQKPLTALVFKGDKGVGKNALIDRIGNLFNGHYLLTSNKRYLTSNFNKHLANLVLFVLDEAFWSGDKQAEGILKDLITGHTHLIEHKGREMFSAKNVTRLCIIGNEDWVVPASKDERRYAIFNVSDKRQGDKKYFKKMRKLIDIEGGNRLLLKELLEFDLDSVDINTAPDTVGLLEQKLASLGPIQSWWYSCLKEGTILGHAGYDFNGGWPENVSRGDIRDAFIAYSKKRGVRSWLPDAGAFGKSFQKVMPNLKSKRISVDNQRVYAYVLPNLAGCRKQFEEYIRHKVDWEDPEGPDETEPPTNLLELFK